MKRKFINYICFMPLILRMNTLGGPNNKILAFLTHKKHTRRKINSYTCNRKWILGRLAGKIIKICENFLRSAWMGFRRCCDQNSSKSFNFKPLWNKRHWIFEEKKIKNWSKIFQFSKKTGSHKTTGTQNSENSLKKQ